MSISTVSPEAAYYTKGNNIKHPGTADQVTAAIVKAKLDVATDVSAATVTGGTIT